MKKEKYPEGKKINLIFIGTPDFGVPSLNALSKDDGFNILAVITQPDKKSGRGQIMSYPSIKKEALKLENELGIKIPILQPNKISNIEEKIKKLNPDIIIVIAYAQLIPENILNIPKYGCINIHGSLLPKYRGAACIQEAILQGDKKTGISFMLMDKKLDTGAIIKNLSIPINNSDTTGSIFDKLAVLSAEKIGDVLKKYISGKIKPVPQDNSKATYVKTLSKKDGHLDWNKPALELERFIRAMTPWPSAFSYLDKKIIKILQSAPRVKTSAEIVKINKYKAGEIFSEDKKLFIQCKENSLEILEIQIEGGKKLQAQDFLNGHSDFIGMILE